MTKIETFNRPLCVECTGEHVALNKVPVCCAVGKVALRPGEAEKIGLPPETTLMSIEGGCKLWEAGSKGCTVYLSRPHSCRAFPRVESHSQLLLGALSKYENCPLIQLILALWDRDVETKARIIHPQERINNTPLFDSQDLNLIANLLHWHDNSFIEAEKLLDQASQKYSQTEEVEPIIILFTADPTDGGIRPSPFFTLTEINQLEYREGYPILAGLVYPSLENLPPEWILNP